MTKTKECREEKKKKVCPFFFFENSRPYLLFKNLLRDPGLINLPRNWFSQFLTKKRIHEYYVGFPDGSDSKESASNAGDTGLTPGSKIPRRRKWLPTPVFLPREFHGHGSLEESDMTEWLTLWLHLVFISSWELKMNIFRYSKKETYN